MTKTSVEETGKLADLFSVDLALKVRRRLRAFETAERRIEMCAKDYDKDHEEPGELLFSVRALLDICSDISPTAGKIYDEFYKAVLSFVHADIRHLEEAFGMSRPKNWRQDAQKFFSQKGREIEQKVDELIEQGSVKPAVFGEVGKILGASQGKIQKAYYDYRKLMRLPRLDAEEEQKQREDRRRKEDKRIEREQKQKWKNMSDEDIYEEAKITRRSAKFYQTKYERILEVRPDADRNL